MTERSTKLSDLGDDDGYASEEEFIVESNKTVKTNVQKQLKYFLLSNLKELLLIVSIVLLTNFDNQLFNFFPLMDNMYSVLISKAIISSAFYLIGKYYLLN